jgi:hypothetical protein
MLAAWRLLFSMLHRQAKDQRIANGCVPVQGMQRWDWMRRNHLPLEMRQPLLLPPSIVFLQQHLLLLLLRSLHLHLVEFAHLRLLLVAMQCSTPMAPC